MNKHVLLLGFSFLFTAAPLAAGVREISVTPDRLDGWEISGTDREEIANQATLRLPAGSELARIFSGGAVFVSAVAKVQFATEPEEWPMLLVGPAALAFTTKSSQTGVALLVEQQLFTIPIALPLDATGCSLQPLEIVLGYDPATHAGVLFVGDRSLMFKARTSAPSLETIVSAGEGQPWVLDSLDVLIVAQDENPSDQAKPGNTASSKLIALLQKTRSRSENPSGNLEDREGLLIQAVSKPAAVTRNSALEIYTPPSVHHGIGAARTAIAQTLGK